MEHVEKVICLRLIDIVDHMCLCHNEKSSVLKDNRILYEFNAGNY
jgi:hypothetical protein